jgi:hypothetical protein
MSTIVLHTPGAPRAERQTPTFLLRLWAALEAHGQRRAAVELRRVAARHAYGDPALANQLMAAADAATSAADHTSPRV